MTELVTFHGNEARFVKRPAVTSALLLIFILSSAPAQAGETSVIMGRVLDREGKAVQGAEVFLYNSPDVRRPADFISPKTDADGRFSVTLPRGTYWAVARLRSGGERYGPLMPGDRHSGDPVEIELTSAMREAAFTVMDLREAALTSQKKTSRDYVKIQGRILDKSGKPVKAAYAAANRNPKVSGMPHYLSAWTDEEGRYTLFLPRGKYYVGAAAAFPPLPGWAPEREMKFTDDAGNVDIVIHGEAR